MLRTIFAFVSFVGLFNFTDTYAQSLHLDTAHSEMLGGYTLFVGGETDRSLILGATLLVREKNGFLREYDVHEDLRIAGSFKKNFTMPDFCRNNNPEYWFWRAALWETRVDNCGCTYCLRNGFHLENKVCSFEWIPATPGKLEF
jgi:hypothetical protein